MNVGMYPLLGNDAFLTLSQQPRLRRHFPQPPNNLLIPIQEGKNRIGDLNLSAKLHNKLLCLAQVMPRHAREQVMDGLELEAAVEEI
ncbi:hypothetical protein ACKS0A_03028 [Histoplasma ohiense]